MTVTPPSTFATEPQRMGFSAVAITMNHPLLGRDTTLGAEDTTPFDAEAVA